MKLTTIVMLILMLANTGCLVSYLSAKGSQREIATERIMASDNKDALYAVKMGVPAEDVIRAIPIQDGIGIGVNILDWETLIKHPLRQLGAAALDAAWMYGTYQLTQNGNNTSQNIAHRIEIFNSDHVLVIINQNEITRTITRNSTCSCQNQ